MKLKPCFTRRYGVDSETGECYLSGKVSSGRLVTTEYITRCYICGPNKGCNASSRACQQIRNWKRFRKTQYR